MSTTQETLVPTDSGRPEECECGRERLEAVSNDYIDLDAIDLIPCLPCALAAFETVNPDAERDDDE